MSYRARLAIALVTIYLVWGSTYLAIAIGVRTLPPLAMAAVRFLTAGFGLFAFLRARGVPRPSAVEWRTAALVGTFLLGGGNGLVTTHAHALPSGIVALILATTPLFMVLLPMLGGERPRAVTLVATALGLAGVGSLVSPSGGGRALPISDVLAIVAAALSWSVGSLISKRSPAAESPMMATAQQMIAGGLVLALVAVATGELAAFDPASISLASTLALAYLTVFGSITGFGAYVWLLRNTSPAVATSYAYVNPLVALALGHVLAGEPFGARTAVASAAILGAVVLLVTDAGRSRVR